MPLDNSFRLSFVFFQIIVSISVFSVNSFFFTVVNSEAKRHKRDREGVFITRHSEVFDAVSVCLCRMP